MPHRREQGAKVIAKCGYSGCLKVRINAREVMARVVPSAVICANPWARNEPPHLAEGIAPTLNPGYEQSQHFTAEVPLVVLPPAHGAVADRLKDLSVARRADEPFGARVPQ